MSSRRVSALALAADLVAVVVFAAVGRASHTESDGLLGLLGTAAPFAVGVLLSRVVPVVRAAPGGLRAGGVVLAAAVVVGLGLRALLLGRSPLSFAVVTLVSLAVLLLGWRGGAALVARRGVQRVR